jgi:hypothetical protein
MRELVPSRRVRKWLKNRVPKRRNWRGKRMGVVRHDFEVFVAKQPTGDFGRLGARTSDGTSGREPYTGHNGGGLRSKGGDVAIFTLQTMQ